MANRDHAGGQRRQFTIRKSRRLAIPLRVALLGPTNSGKSYSGLAIALHMAEELGLGHDSVVVIDTEVTDSGDEAIGSVEKYCEDWCRCQECQGHGMRFEDFGTVLLPPCEQRPDDYVSALAACRAQKVPIVLLDSMSHEWEACLRIVDDIKMRARNKWSEPWGEVTPIHDRFIRAVLTYPGHIICTLRAKEKHKTQDGKVTSLGMQPIQRPGIMFEFDIGLYLENARAHIIKTRSAELHGRSFDMPGKAVAQTLLRWSRGGHDEREAAKDAEAGDAGAVVGIMELRKRITAIGKSDAAKRMHPQFLVDLRAHFKAADTNPRALAKTLAWAQREIAAAENPPEEDPFADDPDPTPTGTTRSATTGPARSAPRSTTEQTTPADEGQQGNYPPNHEDVGDPFDDPFSDPA